MLRLGSYELLREIHRSPAAVVYAARQADDETDAVGRYAVKAFDADRYGLLESVASAQTFLDRAALQAALSAQGARHWAAIREAGDTDTPYYVTDLYPLTARKVVDRGAAVGPRGLYTIVWSVVRGLTEMREMFRRAHGNLKLTNVLIRGEDLRTGTPKTTEVVLVDPSVEAHSARDRSADLYAVGELIHQLVLKRPSKTPPGPDDLDPPLEPDYPVPYTTAWRKLGPQGDGWLDLCNWLLSPDPSDRPPDLVAVAVALHQLAPAPSRKARKWVAAAGAVALAGGAGAAALYHVNGTARAELAAVNQQWFAAFEQALDDPARQQRYAADDTLRAVTAMVRDAERAGVRFDPANDSMFSYPAYRNARAAAEVAQRVERELTPERWQRLAAQNALRQRYEARGWMQPAMFIETLTAAARPGATPDLAAGVDRMMIVTSQIGLAAAALDEQWARYEADLKVAADAGDPALAAFARSLRESAGAALRLTDGGFDGLGAFTARQPLAARLAAVVRGGFPRGYGRERIAAEVESKLNLASPTDADVRTWLDEVKQYELVQLDPKAEPLAGLGRDLEKLGADVERQGLSEQELGEYAAERAEVQERVAALGRERFVRRHVAQLQGEIPARASELKRDLDGLRKKWVRLDDPGKWVEYIDRPLVSASDALKERWKAYVAGQKARVAALTADARAFKAAKAQAELVNGVLTELDRQFPQGQVAGLSGAFVNAARERRERDLLELSKWAAGPTPTPPTDLGGEFAAKLGERANAYAEWCAKLPALAKDFPIQKELLTPADRPDVAWAAKEKAFWEDPVVQNLVRPDLERIAALAAVATMPRDALLKAASDPKQATEIVLAAWRRLGDPAAAPAGAAAWPGTAEELQQEQLIREQLRPMLAKLQPGPDRARADEEWRAQGAVRWRRFTNGAVLAAPGADPAGVKQRIKTALVFENRMLAAADQVDLLEPVARFNYALYRAGEALTERSDAVVAAETRRLQAAVAALKDRPDVQLLSRRLARVREPEPMSVDARLLAAQPPGEYVLPLGEEPPLKFVRVTPQAGRPFYLATTELSVGQFRELVNGTGNWAAANALLGNVPPAGGAGPVPHRGPRVWERPAAASAAIERLVEWRFNTAAGTPQPFRFDVSLRQSKFNAAALNPEYGDNPKLDHPMQHLPAQAALFAVAAGNFRLPTPREWLAAYEQELTAAGGDAAKLDANRRDATWRRQQAFSATVDPPQWPDAEVSGAFWPRGQARPAGAAAVAALPTDDRTLFFRPVTGGSGLFQNLVGNVSEFACDQADAFDAVPAASRRSVEGIQQFCKQAAASITVIGGSAFSAPELDVARAYPVASPAEPYADVGVRPAFTAPAAGVADRLKGFLDDQPYLAAAAVAKAGG